jgi:hypothetical protein
MSKCCKKNHIRTRRKYTYKDKVRILQNFEHSNDNASSFARKINIPIDTLSTWIKNKEKIYNTTKQDVSKYKKGSGRKPIFDNDFEATLLKWITMARSKGVPITNKLIIRKAYTLKNEMNIAFDCSFSNGWIHAFRKRHNIVTRKSGSKIIRTDDGDIDDIINFIETINEEINVGEYSSIINIDETAICYDPKIDTTLDIKGTKRIEIKNTGRDKQRITVILGIDLLNNIKVKPMIILKGTTGQCLNNIPLSNSYTLSYQKKSWCTYEQFIKFLSFLPKDKKILLIYDNFGGHIKREVKRYLKKEFPLIRVFLLPPNTTSILQPLDMGVNKPFKNYIKTKYLDWLIKYVDDNNIIPKLPKSERSKLLVSWIAQSFNNINNTIVYNSFIACGYCLPSKSPEEWKIFYHII